MKRLTLMLLCLSYFTFAQEGEKPGAPAASSPKAKETVAVYIAGKETKESQGMHAVLGGELVRAISASSGYSAVDRTVQALALLEKEHLYQRGGAVKDEDAMALGKQLAARYLCVAEVQPVRGGAYYLNVRLIDVETAAAVASVTETSALEDATEMRRVAQSLANTLLGGKSEAEAVSAPKPVEPAPAPITARSRRADAEAAAASERLAADAGTSAWAADGDAQTGEPDHSAASRGFESGCGDRDGRGGAERKIRYGGRLAGSLLLPGYVIEDRDDGGNEYGIDGGVFFSLGLTMSVPLTNALSLNHELLFDIRSMDLSFDDTQKNVTEYAISFPVVVRFESSYFYAEAGLRFDYPLVSDISFAGTDREQMDMGYVAGVGVVFGVSSLTCYLGYRFEGNVTDFDKGNHFFGSYRNSVGLTLLF
ncbi:hypothetical protein R80B4_02936 [Fibrobacteres bacterium R8-0-B4]